MAREILCQRQGWLEYSLSASSNLLFNFFGGLPQKIKIEHSPLYYFLPYQVAWLDVLGAERSAGRALLPQNSSLCTEDSVGLDDLSARVEDHVGSHTIGCQS